MKAMISGRAQTAVVAEGERLGSLHFADPSSLVLRRAEEIRYLLAGAEDVRFVEVAGLREAVELLEEAVACAKGLDATLVLLDDDSAEATRASAASGLQRLLTRPAVWEHVEAILYAAPLPDSADVDGALQICASAGISQAHSLLKRLHQHQPAITDISIAWDATVQKELDSVEKRERTQERCLCRNLFPTLARCLAGGRPLEDSSPAIETVDGREFLDAWIDRIYRVNALRVVFEEVEDESRAALNRARLKQRAEGELQLIRQLRQESLTGTDQSRQRWNHSWDQLIQAELVEDLLDLLCLAFPAKRHRRTREKVVREVLIHFQNDGIYRYEEQAAGEWGLLNYLAKTCCRAMKRQISADKGDKIEPSIADLIDSDPPCGRDVELDSDRGIVAWLAGFSGALRDLVWRKQNHETPHKAANVLRKPVSVVRYVWDELRRKTRRIAFQQAASHPTQPLTPVSNASNSR